MGSSNENIFEVVFEIEPDIVRRIKIKKSLPFSEVIFSSDLVLVGAEGFAIQKDFMVRPGRGDKKAPPFFKDPLVFRKCLSNIGLGIL